MLAEGIYEQLISKLLLVRIEELGRTNFYIQDRPIDKEEAAMLLSQYLMRVVNFALGTITGEGSINKQIELSNKLISLLQHELKEHDFEYDLIDTKAKLLSGVFSKLDARFSDIEQHLKSITPYTRLSQSELFTGNNAGISLESELKKEILSSNRICFLVSFIKWSGIRIFERELAEFTENGGQLQVITTSYMGATDLKAVQYLSSLKNTQVKISYNTQNERLHAKSYLFYRNTGFHTGYIGSSNISRTALTSGLEWNIKITTREVSHIIDKFQKTFDTYWEDKEFEEFIQAVHSDKLKTALRIATTTDYTQPINFFDIKPYAYQQEILEKLESERVLHGRIRNLLVAATGTGKTVVSAFDYKRFRSLYPTSRLLFVAHRKEILQQALATFRGILRDNNFGQLWVDGLEPDNYNHLFASVQTLANRLNDINLSSTYFDFIIIDEVHHITAESYRPILARFSSKILLGLTATPERMDGEDILKDFSGVIAAEIRLPEALNKKLLCPFQYFGISDSVDLSHLQWKSGRYVPAELNSVYTQNDRRVGEILKNLEKYLRDINDVCALGFCVSQVHAQYMAEKFLLAGLRADYLISSRNQVRDDIRVKLQQKTINYLFVVDIFNEGVDIPEIDTILFLRPTESLTVFLQQFGRGLRLAEGKECLTVLDFVGNSRPEYDFERKFRALVGKTANPIQKEIEDDFPHLPLGCTIVLERKAKEIIIDNIRYATALTKKSLVQKISNFTHQSTLPLTLKNFLSFYDISLHAIYKRGSWKQLCYSAGQINNFSNKNEGEIWRAISKKWLTCTSISYFKFILRLAKKKFDIKFDELGEDEKLMCTMLYYDVWQEENLFSSIEDSIKAIGKNEALVDEIIEFLELIIDKIDFLEKDIQLPFKQPLKLHSRYTKDQIFAAFEFSTFSKKSSIREGVADSKEKNVELLFVTLNKSEMNFSPTNLYKDFAVSETLFEWQTQNSARPDKGKGYDYINHRVTGKKILLFVREQAEDEFKNTMGFVFLGEVNLQDHYGEKPMSIKWELSEPMPPYIWKESAKMAIG